MTSPVSSLSEHILPIEAGAHVIAAAFLDGAPVLALGDGAILLGEPNAQKRLEAHPEGAILVGASDGERLVTGGDDGRVVTISSDGSAAEIADEKGRWIDAIATRNGAIAWAAGRDARARDAQGAVKSRALPS